MAKKTTRSSNAVRQTDTPDESNANVSDADVYSFLTANFLHQDRLSWSRTQTIVAVEAAILAASFAKPGVFAIITLAFGSTIVWLVWRLIKRDWEVRDQNLKHLDAIHSPRDIVMAVPAANRWSRGTFVLAFLVYLVLSVNSVLGLCHLLVSIGIDSISIKGLIM